ncbi:MAG: tetraacyldisaccharide 4'-kinase [Flavobacteriales bacterium]|nr:tetraacyldisaccharide 4'-kinase [Flavobacteriales bacterium]
MHQLRWLLLPLSWVYAVVLRVRHFFYDSGILKSFNPSQKTIVIGNLSLGGTGKTPMVNTLIKLHDETSTAVLSRGYGRKTQGTLEVETDMSANESGDEPLLIKKNNPNTLVIVDELRSRGLKYLKAYHPNIHTVILDDAMQHRKVKASLNILLTTFDKPFFSDHLLPAGNLRDIKSRAHDADLIVVTKTPPEAPEKERQRIKSGFVKYDKPIFFTEIRYGEICDLNGRLMETDLRTHAVVITGIASPNYFIHQVATKFKITKHFDYRDHYQFTLADIEKLSNFIDTFDGEKPVVITTEKDAQRLGNFKGYFLDKGIELYFWKIETIFCKDMVKFNKLIASI